MRRICILSFFITLLGSIFFVVPAECRYYDPKTGRFLQRDPLEYHDSMNLYTYVGNQPVNYTDPYGLLNPKGACVGWVCVYTKEQYEEAKKKLKDELKKRYPWMDDKVLEKSADDIMQEMTIAEAQELGNLQKQNKPKEQEELIKEICERTGGDCDPKEPENNTCEK